MALRSASLQTSGLEQLRNGLGYYKVKFLLYSCHLALIHSSSNEALRASYHEDKRITLFATILE